MVIWILDSICHGASPKHHSRSTPHTLRVWRGRVGRLLCPVVCTMGLRSAIASCLWLLFKWPLNPFLSILWKAERNLFLFLIERQTRVYKNDSPSLWDNRCLEHKPDGMAHSVCRTKPNHYGTASPLQPYFHIAVPRTVRDKNLEAIKIHSCPEASPMHKDSYH